MSTISCDSCSNLREHAPEFVQNGVTDDISASLKNNTGLNPASLVLHSNCDDLNDANDCLIGRMSQELEAYDVCDWKAFMGKFLPNDYEVLKGVIASMCGLWTRSERLCASVDNLLNIVTGTAIKHHPGEYFPTFLDKVTVVRNGVVEPDKTIWHPSWRAEINSGAGCTANKKIGRYALGNYWSKSAYPYDFAVIVNEPIDIDEPIGIIPASAMDWNDISQSDWRWLLRTTSNYLWYMIGRDTQIFVYGRGYTTVGGEVFNADLAEYGEDNMVLFIGNIIGETRTGGLRVGTYDAEYSYVIA